MNEYGTLMKCVKC